MAERAKIPARAPWRERVFLIIFEADTPAGKAFDVALLVAIIASIVAVMLESVDWISREYRFSLRVAEWVFTGLFTAEYILRLLCVPRASAYARSFFGLVDLASIAPSFLSLLVPRTHSLLVIRSLRLLRVFRIFKLAQFLGEANVLAEALRASRHKVMVFLGTVLVMVVIFGTAMFVIEGEESGFTSIPRSMYWAIVTMTTVGYGDVAPQTVLGQLLASAIMITGYGIIAVPTGIVTAEIVSLGRKPITTRSCPSCLSEGHLHTAKFCRDCGAELQKSEDHGATGSKPEP
jgi:voltage-gated potassium channel